MTTIRSWRREDLPRVGGLLAELAAALGEDFKPDAALLAEHFDAMAEAPGVYRNFVAELDDRVVGFLSLACYRSAFHRKGTVLVNELAVEERARGLGVGGALIEHALDLARDEGWDELEAGVMKDNEGAIRFYKAHGISEEYLLLGKEFDEA
ncbi:MAG: GNAT family N-acetyltransferase [Spirochaetia bacterium]|nr:GNAT family N-acetyltransferase [Spirochaetia bacterium]